MKPLLLMALLALPLTAFAHDDEEDRRAEAIELLAEEIRYERMEEQRRWDEYRHEREEERRREEQEEHLERSRCSIPFAKGCD